MKPDDMSVLIGLAGASIAVAILLLAALALLLNAYRKKSRLPEVTPLNDTEPHRHHYIDVSARGTAESAQTLVIPCRA